MGIIILGRNFTFIVFEKIIEGISLRQYILYSRHDRFFFFFFFKNLLVTMLL